MICGDCHQATCGPDCPGSGYVDADAPIDDVRRLEGQVMELREYVYQRARVEDWDEVKAAGALLKTARRALSDWRNAADPDLAALSVAREISALQAEEEAMR